MTEAQIDIAARVNDRAFFRLGRIWFALRRDPTANVEIALAVLGFLLNGILIKTAVTTFPPQEVEFLLRSWGLTEPLLSALFMSLGVLQVLGTGTRSHRTRGAIAVVALVASLMVMMAYAFAGLPSHFQAWVMYSSMTVGEFFVAVRNFGDHYRVEQARAFLQSHLGRG